MHHDDDVPEQELSSRRQMMKKTALGAAAAGIVWSAPKVEGLSLRPHYAAAASGGAGPQLNATMIFRVGTVASPALPGAAGATSGGLCNGFASARGNRPDFPLQNANKIKITSYGYNGSGSAQIVAINTGGNVSDNVLFSGGPAVFPANLDGTYDLTLLTRDTNHSVRVVFTCC